jgi:ATP-dependent DNA helicase RecQ
LTNEGGAAVLTRTNEESLLIKAILDEEGIDANLVMERSGFRVKNMIEMETFSHWIKLNADQDTGQVKKETFHKLLDKLVDQYPDSKYIGQVRYAIENFSNDNRRLFKSDWYRYLEDLRHEDIVPDQKDKIWVSTMHKVKGKEFRHVFLYLDRFPFREADDYRIFYVAISRAMESLRIFSNDSYISRYIGNYGKIFKSQKDFAQPSLIRIPLTLEDVHLGKAKHQQLQKALTETKCEITMAYDSTDQSLHVGQGVLYLSKRGKARISHWETKGYEVLSTELDQVVIWRDEKEEYRKGYRIPLCIMSMGKKGDHPN